LSWLYSWHQKLNVIIVSFQRQTVLLIIVKLCVVAILAGCRHVCDFYWSDKFVELFWAVLLTKDGPGELTSWIRAVPSTVIITNRVADKINVGRRTSSLLCRDLEPIICLDEFVTTVCSQGAHERLTDLWHVCIAEFAVWHRASCAISTLKANTTLRHVQLVKILSDRETLEGAQTSFLRRH